MLTTAFLLVILLFVSCTKGATRSAHFFVAHDRAYKSSSAVSFLSNVSTTSINQCTTRCLSRISCETAIFYSDINICSLFDEQSWVGMLFNYIGAYVLTIDSNGSCINRLANITLLNLFNISTNNYMYYSYLYTTCAQSATITFSFRHDVDTWCLDDVSVSNGSHNLIINGDFETGTLAGWNYSSSSNNSFYGVVTYSRLTAFPYTGTYFYDDGIYNGIDYLSQTFVTIPMHKYNISFWLRSNAYSNQSNLIISSTFSITS